jgi:hypothetical protein
MHLVPWNSLAVSATGAFEAVSQSHGLLTFTEKTRIDSKDRLTFFHE